MRNIKIKDLLIEDAFNTTEYIHTTVCQGSRVVT